MQWEDALYGTIKNGILTLNGFVSNVTVEHGSLLIRDGVKGAVVERKFNRASCPISRIISLGSEGYISFGAVRWLHDIGASVIHLNYDGSPLLTTVSAKNDPVPLRRLQAVLTADKALGSSIACCLIRSKIAGQIAVLKEFGHRDRAAEAADYAESITSDTNISQLLGIEGTVAKMYWQSMADITLQFGRRQSIPDHWKTFGNRYSTLTVSPRAAVTPGNAMLNYLYGVLASEITIALHTLGLDLAFGVLHADKENRASLAYDLMEPARPIVDRWFFHWLQSTTFSKRDFFEDHRGQIRLMRPLNSHLAMTSVLWREVADQLAQWFCKRLSGESAPLRLKFVNLEVEARRRAARWALGNALQPPIPTTCMECGRVLPTKRRKFCSHTCAKSYHGGELVDARLAKIAPGPRRMPRPRPAAQAPTHPGRIMSVRNWHQQPGWSSARDAEMRKWFTAALLPRLRDLRSAAIRQITRLDASYAIAIKHGRKIPHPRFYRVLAELVGAAYPYH